MMKKTQKTPTKAHKSDKTLTVTVRKIIPILGVKIDSSHNDSLLKQARSWMVLGTNVNRKRAFFITTPNPEIVTQAVCDKSLRDSLNSSDLALPDGIGIIAAMKYLSLVGELSTSSLFKKIASGVIVGTAILINQKWLKSESDVVPGRLFMEELIGEANRIKNKKIYLLGGKKGVADIAAKVLTEKYGTVKIEANAGPWLDNEGRPKTETEKEREKGVIREINAYEPDLLFVAFGPPKQEKWLLRNLPYLNARIAMVVGGSFDYLAGIVPVPPKIISDWGFEWFWRLITQPSRFNRILNAVVVFPYKIFTSR